MSTMRRSGFRAGAAVCSVAWFSSCSYEPRTSQPPTVTVVSAAAPASGPAGSASALSGASPSVQLGCQKYEWGRRGRGSSSHVDNHPQEFNDFLLALRAAVSASNKDAVLRLVHLPSLGVTRDEFLSKYDQVMTPCMREAIRCSRLDEVAEDYLGAWVGHDTLLVNEVEEGVFMVTGFPNQGVCRPKRGTLP